MSKLEELKKEADTLGLEYGSNIGEKTLKSKIDRFKEDKELEEFTPRENKRVVVEDDPQANFKKKMLERRKKAFKRSKVIVYNNDPREREFSTTMSKVQNSYYGSGKVIPIGQEWWLEQMHIDNLKSIEILTYVKDPKTGNSVAKKTRKFTIDIIDTDEESAMANIGKN